MWGWLIAAGALVLIIIVSVIIYRRIKKKREGYNSHLPRNVKLTFRNQIKYLMNGTYKAEQAKLKKL